MKYRHLSVLFLLLYISIIAINAQHSLVTPFERSEGRQSITYEEGIDYCELLAFEFNTVELLQIGMTDAGLPLHLVVYDSEGFSGLNKIKISSKLKVMIMNAIHPGEPAGVDASLILLRDLAAGKILQEINQQFILMIIPFYNTGGALNRGSFSRANQNGPEAYGFRGNARNLDLNRDFIKMDSRNACSFARIFHVIDPDIFIDTHTTNGADYSYALTYIETQPDRMGGALGPFIRYKFSPALEERMYKLNKEIIPYVNIFGQAPDKEGYSQFVDLPRYSSGYVSLFQTIGYVTEAHMFKPFRERMLYTMDFLKAIIAEGSGHNRIIKKLREQDRQYFIEKKQYTTTWGLDRSVADTLSFRGYQAAEVISKVTGHPIMKYNRSKPFIKPVPFYNTFTPVKEVSIPDGYLVSGAWTGVIERLRKNKIELFEVKNDTTLLVESYRINSYETYDRPWEGHYTHYNTRTGSSIIYHAFRKGDYYIPTRQPGIRYILETLEPEASDSFFNWNFFDPILMQKEYFSSYVFDDTAEEIIRDGAWLRDSLEDKRAKDPLFRDNNRMQLDYIYKNSVYYEKEHLRYPVYRFNGSDDFLKQ